jgi:transcriptional regulator of acetoin/glycerol metabolism
MSTTRENALAEAILALSTDQYPSIRAAAKAFGVSHDTLGRRMKGGLINSEA